MRIRWYPSSLFYDLGRLTYTYAFQLSCLESLHSRNYIHRDVKPTNFMIGTGEQNTQVFLIDFGLAQLFRNPSTRRHFPLVSGLETVGTIAFASINSHSGQTQTRRDDLESLVYSIIYLCRGSLPWQDAIKEGVDQYEAVVLGKKIAFAKRLCKGLPRPFAAFAQHVQSLDFDEKPQYDYLHSLLTQCSGSSAHHSNGVKNGVLPPSRFQLGVPTSFPHSQRM